MYTCIVVIVASTATTARFELSSSFLKGALFRRVQAKIQGGAQHVRSYYYRR